MVDEALQKANGTYERPVDTTPRKRRGAAARNSTDDLASTC